jgi:lactoylglutathione lyase
MKIEHIAIWVKNLELMRDFYMKYFQMNCKDKYINEKKGFSSYFLSFADGARIEIMHREDIAKELIDRSCYFGFTHIAISVGSKEKVDEITEKIREKGFTISGEPRTTGDGYYESVIIDPEGNIIEITE